MDRDTKALLKGASSNIVTIFGYVSTASTFLPVMAFIKPFLLPLGIALMAVGVFLGASSVMKHKNREIGELKIEGDKKAQSLNAEKDAEIARLNQQIIELARKPYSEELRRTAHQILNAQMTEQGRLALRYLLMNEPIEVGRVFIPIDQVMLHDQLGIAMRGGIVQHREEGTGLRRT